MGYEDAYREEMDYWRSRCPESGLNPEPLADMPTPLTRRPLINPAEVSRRRPRPANPPPRQKTPQQGNMFGGSVRVAPAPKGKQRSSVPRIARRRR